MHTFRYYNISEPSRRTSLCAALSQTHLLGVGVEAWPFYCLPRTVTISAISTCRTTKFFCTEQKRTEFDCFQQLLPQVTSRHVAYFIGEICTRVWLQENIGSVACQNFDPHIPLRLSALACRSYTAILFQNIYVLYAMPPSCCSCSTGELSIAEIRIMHVPRCYNEVKPQWLLC